MDMDMWFYICAHTHTFCNWTQTHVMGLYTHSVYLISKQTTLVFRPMQAQKSHKHTHIQPGSLPDSQLLLWCNSALLNHGHSWRRNGGQYRLVSGLFCVVRVCLCAYKIKQPTNRQDSLGGYETWKKEKRSEMSSNFKPPDCMLETGAAPRDHRAALLWVWGQNVLISYL